MLMHCRRSRLGAPLKILEQFLKLLATQITITKNLSKQARPNCFASVNWHDGRAAIWVMQKMMATFDAKHHKTSLLQD
ncbi:MAG: hypothetical protein A2Z44_04175 [Betaproteobacteria bacterium RBG_19FT_COMBO_58_11]|nr:MAG: hypothetical protein A2Z44_04175 [Betaproteobacteria bacterium RBG_19FT_COMBO_58_11]